jgi:hypothetical protein
MSDKIKPISRIKKVSKVKLRLHKHKTMTGLYFNEMLSRSYDKKYVNKLGEKSLTETEENNDSGNYIIDKLC